jgi:rod shape-determining protein MreC
MISLVLISIDRFILFNRIRIPAIARGQTLLLSVSHAFDDFSYSVRDSYVEYKRIRQENAILKAKIQKLTIELQTTKNAHDDASKIYSLLHTEYSDFKPILAKALVSPNFVSKEQILFAVDKQQNKIKISNVVVNQKGVIGQVINTSPGYAIVNFLSASNFKIYVQNASGSKLLLQGNGNDSMIINYLGLTTKIAVGDVLYTTGLDNSYPANLPVAKVNSIKKNGNFLTVYCQTIVKKDTIDFAMILI